MTAPTDPSRRQCGRCRQHFDGDAALHAGAIADWWACDPRRLKLGMQPERRTDTEGSQ
jgi:hypothetical protein